MLKGFESRQPLRTGKKSIKQQQNKPKKHCVVLSFSFVLFEGVAGFCALVLLLFVRSLFTSFEAMDH